MSGFHCVFRRTLLVAAVAVLGQSNCAWASCGDYLHTKFDRPAEKSVPAPYATERTDQFETASESPPVAPASPCHGPGCKGQPQAPGSPAQPLPATQGGPTDGVIASLTVARAESESKGDRGSNKAAPLSGFPMPMERPPQSSL